ncbi:hypothetical protein NHX12_024757 [Muraenolepis orangiensis]|uniref:FHA domain-containing protein n=1 Tax=Muraenolepis orangiensis TaxID=630683 RepID=A0A9Q0ISL7_9TELE|nr:hypothetical protein NHX12_024757 [Muraenolepis orangiensis]
MDTQRAGAPRLRVTQKMSYGKIVVIKRGGGDGTEFPLTTACLFGRKADCDIRIQLPHVSKEHCRVELNENKEVILTNISSVNPTRVNGAELQQVERLKHGDIITIIDRSFRFEYPPQQTPKKTLASSKTDGLQILLTKVRIPGENGPSEISTGPGLKDGANNDNIQHSLEKTTEGEESFLHGKTDTAFSELYQMIKHSLETPRKPAGHQPQTPAAKSGTPKSGTPKPVPGSITKVVVQAAVPAEAAVGVTGDHEATVKVVATAKSPKKARRSLDATAAPDSKKKRLSLPAKTPSTVEVEVEKPTTPTGMKSKEATPVKPAVEDHGVPTMAACATPPARVKPSPRVSPRSVEKELKVQSVQKELEAKAALSEQIATKKREMEAAAVPRMLRKRVSFGGHLTPELFDKRLPPSSPLQKGAFPRRSLSSAKPKQSLLRRASAIGLIKEFDNVKTPKAKSPATKSPKAKTPSSPKAKTPSPAKAKTPSPAKAKTPSPAKAKTPSPAKKSPKARTPSPAKKSPKAKTPSPAKKSPKAKTPSPAKAKTPSPAKKSPKAKTPSPAKKPPKAKSQPRTPGIPSPSVNGRFSVSLIDEQQATVPKVPLRRKSISRKTPKSVLKNTAEVLRRRSGVSRASMKVVNSWVDIVKFGQTKSLGVAPSKKPAAAQKVKKAAVAEPKTPTRKSIRGGHVTTGHAESPVTIVVGRAFNQRAVQHAGAAPKLVHNSEAGSSFNNEKTQEVVVEEPLATPEETIAPVEEVMVDEPLATPEETIAPVEEVMVDEPLATPEETIAPVEEVMVEEPLATPEETIAPVEEVVVEEPLATAEETIAPVEEVMVEEPLATAEETIAPVEEVMVDEPLATAEETIALVEEVMVDEPLATPEETIAPVEEVMVDEPLATPEETIAPVEEVMVDEPLATAEETIAPVEEVMVDKPLATAEETIAPVEEVMVDEPLATPEETIAPVEELVVEKTLAAPEETIAPVEELIEKTPAEDIGVVVEVADKPTENAESEDGPAGITEEVSQADITTVEELVVAIETNPQEVAEQSLPEPQPEEERELAPTEEDSVIPAPEPPTKSVRGMRAKTTKPVPAEEPTREEPATPVGGRRGRPTRNTPAPPQAEEPTPVKKGRGRPRKSKNVEELVAASLAEVAQEETSPKPKGETNAEQAPAVEALPETTTAEEPVPGVQEVASEPEVVIGEQVNTAPTEDMVVEDEVADKPTENTEAQHDESAVVESDETTESQVTCEEPQEEAPCVQSEDGPAGITEEVSQADITTELVSDMPVEEPEPVVAIETNPQEVAEQSLPEPQPEEERELAPTEEDSVIPAPEPPTKSVRGMRAKTTKPVPAEEPTQEEPATPVGGRRGRPTRNTPAPPQAEEPTPGKKGGGRPRKSKNVEEPVAASLAEVPQEETSLKPRRGRNAKQAPAVEAVPETTTEETNDQTPSTDDDTTAIPAVTSVKTRVRMGRNLKQVPVKQTSDETQPEEEPVAAVKVEKPKRGRKAVQQEEPPVVAVQEETSEVAADQSPSTDALPEEQPAPIVTVKPKRGKKANQVAAPEPEVVAIEPEEEKVEEVVDIPVVKQVTEKSRQTRKTKQESVEATASEEKEVQAVENSVTEEVKAPVPPSKTRARKGRREEVKAEAPVELASAAEVVEETTAAPTKIPKRGRRPMKADEPEIVIPPTEAQDKPTEKPTRGGRRVKAKPVVVVEEIVAELPEKVEPEQEEVQEEEITQAIGTSAVEQPDKVVKSTRGKRAAVTVPPVAPVKRGRRGAIVPTHEVVEDQESSTAAEDKNVSKSVNWNEDLTVTREIPAPKPTPVLKATRSRKAAVASVSETAAPKIVAKRKVTRGQSRAEEEEEEEEEQLSEVSQPVKRTRKGTKV